MKPLVQKLPLIDNSSFVAKTFRTPDFEVGWHQHSEYELILFTEGSGLSFIGNHLGEFSIGDIYFLGANLPHTFQKSGDQVTSAIVVQFRQELFGVSFLQLPELQPLRNLFDLSGLGLKIVGDLKSQITPMIQGLEHQKGFARMIALLNCLNIIEESREFITVSTQERLASNNRARAIDRVFQYTMEHFKERISLGQIAHLAHLSVPAFCHYFKRSTKKTYVDFLNEIRVSYACRMLSETEHSTATIGFECGYNSIGHFHKQFFRLKGISPLQYRKRLFLSDKLSIDY